MGAFANLINGLSKTKKSFSEKLKYIFKKTELTEDFYDELEETLILSDISVETVEEILDGMRSECKKRLIKSTIDCKSLLKEILINVLEKKETFEFNYPMVFLVIGVNGVGKTTTIGKLAHFFEKQKKKVVLAAADTFRAAASEQLSEWAKRANVSIVKSIEGADPGAVVFDAIASAKSKNADVLLIDTAGRLHNKVNLMNEVSKISKIVEKNYPEAEYHKSIVIDVTTGQNAISQVELFDEAVGLTDIIITKLDGTAKGGIIFSIANQFDLDIRFIGVGEGLDDLIPFNAKDFVDSIID